MEPDSTSTASFVTACEGGPPTAYVAMVTDAQKAAVLQDEGTVSGSLVSRKRRKVGVPSPEEKGSNKSQQKVAFRGNCKEKRKCADGMVADQRRAAGDDVRKKHQSGDKDEVIIILPACLQMYQEVRKMSLCWTRPHCCGDVHQQPER